MGAVLTRKRQPGLGCARRVPRFFSLNPRKFRHSGITPVPGPEIGIQQVVGKRDRRLSCSIASPPVRAASITAASVIP